MASRKSGDIVVGTFITRIELAAWSSLTASGY
jgi:hypothetical protein